MMAYEGMGLPGLLFKGSYDRAADILQQEELIVKALGSKGALSSWLAKIRTKTLTQYE